MQDSQQIFKLHSEYQPTGDQPQAIEKLVKGFKEGNQFETLLGVTGSGKTFTMANVIARLNKPTLVLAHNKTLAAQLYGEMKEFFPENAVEYFVSYYDYYQPEAYVPQSDTYIAKDSSINDEIDKLRHSATAALSERNDVIIVASVSCIYGLGAPIDYKNMVISLRPGMEKDRDDCKRKLIHIQYVRGKNYIRTSNTNRDIYTKIENYKDKLTADDKILYMAGDKANMEYLRAMNEYVMMPVRIKNMVSGNYESAERFEKVIERYDYVFVYRTNQDTIDNIKACFEDGEIERDTLYKVVKNNKTVRLVPEQ